MELVWNSSGASGQPRPTTALAKPKQHGRPTGQDRRGRRLRPLFALSTGETPARLPGPLKTNTPHGGSAAGNNLHDFQAVACVELAPSKFRGRHRLTIEFDHDAARSQLLSDQEAFDRGGELAGNTVAVGRNELTVNGGWCLGCSRRFHDSGPKRLEPYPSPSRPVHSQVDGSTRPPRRVIVHRRFGTGR